MLLEWDYQQLAKSARHWTTDESESLLKSIGSVVHGGTAITVAAAAECCFVRP